MNTYLHSVELCSLVPMIKHSSSILDKNLNEDDGLFPDKSGIEKILRGIQLAPTINDKRRRPDTAQTLLTKQVHFVEIVEKALEIQVRNKLPQVCFKELRSI